MPILNTEAAKGISSPSINSIIGRGINFPVLFAEDPKKNKLLETVEGSAVIGQSIHVILETRIGSRIMNPFFGSRLSTLTFMPNDIITRDLLYYYTIDALQKWERRITVNNIAFEYDRGNEYYIGIIITYIINSTHTPGTYVYPFVLGGEPMSSLLTKKSLPR
jgi:uncharacterized protein